MSVTWELERQMTPIDETKDQEYTMTFSNTLNHVRRIKSGKENLNASLSGTVIFSDLSKGLSFFNQITHVYNSPDLLTYIQGLV